MIFMMWAKDGRGSDRKKGRGRGKGVPKWASSGHLRRCSYADTTNKYLSHDKGASILSLPTMMGH